MPKPMGKRKTKRTYLGSGAGSLRSGTGATAKQQKRKKTLQRLDDITKKLRTVPIPKKAFRPITPKSPATGFNSVFDDRIPPGAKRQRRKTTRTMRRQAKR
tara:strand:+ start:451 stop:753 length:303 start_codon:yes stop_codon:yes gene_type:complete